MHDRLFILDAAHHFGTLDQLDRARQYATPMDEEPARLLRGVNAANNKARANEKALAAKDGEIAQLRNAIRRHKHINAVLAAILGALAWQGLQAVGAYLYQARQ